MSSPVFDLSANWLNNNACDWKSHTKPSILRHSVVDYTPCPGKNAHPPPKENAVKCSYNTIQ